MNRKEIIEATISEMNDKQRNRIVNTTKEYVIVRCSIFNVGAIVRVKCTDTFVNVRNSSGYDYIIDSAYMARCVRSYIKNNS